MKTPDRKWRKMRIGEIIQDGDRKTFGKGWIYADRHAGKPVDREGTYFTLRPQPSSP
jgi:hypothetical protein